ncbi:polyprenol monophosphomannose synthase [soil metagenome]
MPSADSQPDAPRTAVVIATYNESLNAPTLVRQVKELLPDALVIVVDDNSPDGTSALVRDLGLPGVEVITRTNARGYGTAVRDGLIHACREGAERVVTMDCDFSHDPVALPSMFAALEKADLVIGSRYAGGVRVINWQMKRLLLSIFANFYVRTILSLGAEDCTSGYRGYRRELLARMNLRTVRSNGYSFLVEMLWRGKRRGAVVVETPIIFVERREGEPKMSSAVIYESIFMPWRLRLGGKI